MALTSSMFAPPDPGFDLDPEEARRKREATAAGRLAQTISNADHTQGQTTRPTIATPGQTPGWAGDQPAGAGGVRTDKPAPGQTPPWSPGGASTTPTAHTGGWNPQAAVDAALGRTGAPAGQTPPWAGTQSAPTDAPKAPAGLTPPWAPPVDPFTPTKAPAGQTPPYVPPTDPTTTPGMVPVEVDPNQASYPDPGARGGATPTTSSFTDPTGTATTRTPYTNSMTNDAAIPRPTPGTGTPAPGTGTGTGTPPVLPPGSRRPNPPPDGGGPTTPPKIPPPDTGTPTPPTPPPGTPEVDDNDYGGYSKPAWTRPGSTSVPAGWDPAKWNNPKHQTPKYVVGRILSNYPPTTAGFQSAIADIQRAYPGAKAVGNDKIDIPGVGVIDVLQSAGTGGVAWQWIDEANAGSPTPPPAGGGDGAGTGGGDGAPTSGGGGAPAPGGGDGPKPPTPPATPQYQTYQYSTPTPNAPAAPPLLAPDTIAQYAAGKAPEYTKTDTSAQTNTAAGIAGQANPFGAGASNPATQAAMQALMSAMGFAVPDSAASKEAAKETLNAARTQELDALQRQAAASGMSRSGSVLGAQAEIGDGFSGGLTRAYREIDDATRQAGFTNNMAMSGAFSGLGQVQGNEARADYATGQAGQQQQFDQNMSLTQLLQSIGQNDYASKLAGSGQQAQMDQAAAASAQAAGKYQLDWDAARQGQSQTAFQNALASAGFDFQKQQAQAGENYQYASLGQQDRQFNKQIEQQAAQAAAQMGYNWAELSQRDKQFFLDIKLRAALGASAQNQAYIDAIMRGFA